MSDFYVYTWTRPDTGDVFYVGKGRGRRDVIMKKDNPHFVRIVEKLRRAGMAPTVKRISEGLTEEEAFDCERAEILKRGRRDLGTGPLVNMTHGGEGSSGVLVTPERRARMSVERLGRRHSAETRMKMSVAATGRPKSAEHRAALSKSKIGTTLTPEAKAKVSASNTGRVHTDEAIAKMSAARLANNHMLGKTHTVEAREKLSLAIRMSPPRSGGLKGTNLHKANRRWRASIKIDGLTRHLGSFSTAVEAAIAYDAAAVAHWGVGNCYLNFPTSEAA